MILTLITLVAAAFLFVWGRPRADIVALCAVVTLIIGGVLTPQEGLSGFSNPVVIMMAGLFIVGGGIFRTGLAKMVGGRLMSLAGTSQTALFILVMVVTGFIGAFVSNTGTVALMLPIVVSMASGAGSDARRLLMPLAFASSMGGMLTLIGTPPNLVIDETLREAGHKGLSFFSFLPVGMVCMTVGIVVLAPLTRWFLATNDNGKDQRKRRGKSLKQLVEEYNLADNVTPYTVGRRSPFINHTVAELDIQRNYGLLVTEIRRERNRQGALLKQVSQRLASDSIPIEEGDILYVAGSKSQAGRMAGECGLEKVVSEGKIDFYDIGIAELVLLNDSKFVGRSLSEAGLRKQYNINVLGVRRGEEYLTDRLADLRLQQGDTLLVQGAWADIGKLDHGGRHWVVLGQPLEEAARVTLDYKAPLAAAIMLLMVAMMVFNFIPIAPVTAVLIASILMILTGCFRRVEDAYNTINWESIFLIAAMMPMAVALEKTGVSEMVSGSLVSALGSAGPMMLLAGIYLTTSVLTMFISNTATAVLMAPIAMNTAAQAGVNPLPMLFAVAIAASMCFASPFSTPPNALVMKAGQYTFMDYIKVGLPLQVIMGAVMIVVLPLLFPF